jgi:hypothetical protein
MAAGSIGESVKTSVDAKPLPEVDVGETGVGPCGLGLEPPQAQHATMSGPATSVRNQGRTTTVHGIGPLWTRLESACRIERRSYESVLRRQPPPG